MKITRDLIDLVMPSQCGICERPGHDICLTCREKLLPEAVTFSRGALKGIAAFSFSNNISHLLHSYKEKGQASLAKFMGSLFSRALRESAFISPSDCDIFLVPAPSRTANFRSRGFQPSLLLANVIAKDLNRTTRESRYWVLNCLYFSRAVEDQLGLSQVSRRENIQLSMKTNLALHNRTLYLVDDVVTTGATALEATRAIEENGGWVRGIFAFAVSSSPNARFDRK